MWGLMRGLCSGCLWAMLLVNVVQAQVVDPQAPQKEVKPTPVLQPQGTESVFAWRLKQREARRQNADEDFKAAQKGVQGALIWFSRHQNANGSWSLDKHVFKDGNCTCQGVGETKSDVAATAMALLPFFAACQSHESNGPFRTTISRGVDWLVRNQKQDGNLAAGSSQTMYTHGIATIALCEAYGLSGDARLQASAQAAVGFIEHAQDPLSGGWWYAPRQEGGDTSVFGWQFMALKSAQAAGLEVKPETLAGAEKWLKSVSKGKQNGLFAYHPEAGPSPTMTAVGLLSTQWLGAKRDDARVKEGTNYLATVMPHPKNRNCYYWHYASQAVHHMGGELDQKWTGALAKILLEAQEKDGCAFGSWNPELPIPDPHGKAGGRIMITSFAALALQPERYPALLAEAAAAP